MCSVNTNLGEKIKKEANLSICFFLVTRTGIEPMIPPWKGSVLTSWPTGRYDSGSGIRTYDQSGMNRVL